MTKAKVGIALLVAVLLTGALFWFLENFEQVEEVVSDTSNQELLFNPYFLMTAFLEELEMEVEEVDSFEHLHRRGRIDSSTVLFLDSNVLSESFQERDSLLDWVEEDGLHLVLTMPVDSVELWENFFENLQLVPVRYCVFYSDRPSESSFYYFESSEYLATESQQLIDSLFEVEKRNAYDLELHRSFCLSRVPRSPDFMALDREERTVGAVSSLLGEGRITLVSDTLWLRNNTLREEENVLLLADILSLGEEWPMSAVLFVSSRSFGWVFLLLQRSWPLLLSLLLLFLLGLTRVRRFGPLKAPTTLARRRRGEHIEAMGRFLWGHHASDVLLKSSRRALIEAMARRRPSIRTLSPLDQSRMMADELGISREEMWRLLTEVESLSRQEDFRTIIARLEELRRSI